MPVKFIETEMAGVTIVEPEIFSDHRGFFMETYHRAKYGAGGVAAAFVQDNRSHSRKGVLRGLHYQLRRPQDKLVFAVTGEIFDVVVDIRRGSPTFGRWFGTRLSAANGRQLFVPRGFAHGFCVLSPEADVIYKCSDFYDPGDDFGLYWADPDLGIAWPTESPLLSTKDDALPRLAEVPPTHLPACERS